MALSGICFWDLKCVFEVSQTNSHAATSVCCLRGIIWDLWLVCLKHIICIGLPIRDLLSWEFLKNSTLSSPLGAKHGQVFNCWRRQPRHSLVGRNLSHGLEVLSDWSKLELAVAYLICLWDSCTCLVAATEGAPVEPVSVAPKGVSRSDVRNLFSALTNPLRTYRCSLCS